MPYSRSNVRGFPSSSTIGFLVFGWIRLYVAVATVLERLGFQRFVPVEVQDYANVFEIARQAGIDLASFDFSGR